MKRVWLIEAENAKGKPMWRREAPFAEYSKAQMTDLLRLLTAKAELSFDQIFEATGRKQRTDSLDIRKAIQSGNLRSGSEWTLSARVMLKDRDGQLRAPPLPHM